MAEKTETKKSPLQTFKEKLADKKQVKENILEGIKSTNAKVRSLATKIAFKTQEHDFIKKNVLPLIDSDKSKKVLRTIGEKIHREKLAEKLITLINKKVAHVKETKTEEKPAAEAPKA
jgi:hypothetical protein